MSLLSKLKRIHIIIIGSVLCVLAAVGVFFLVISPPQKALQAAQARYDAAYPKGNPGAEAAANRKLNDAIAQVNRVQRTLDTHMQRRMPNLNFARRDIGMLSLWGEQIRTLGPLLEGFAKDPAVEVLGASFSIPPPPASPNSPVFDQDVLVFPLGQVQVMGSFKGVMNNIRRWNNCRRLVMVSSPTIVGNSPNLIAAYNVTCYIFPAAKGGPQIPMAGAAGAQAVAPGQVGPGMPMAGPGQPMGGPGMPMPGPGMPMSGPPATTQ